jgi:DNA-binding MarR family transcriptional regulator
MEKLNRSLTYRLHLLNKASDQISHQTYVTDVGLSLSEARCLATVGSFPKMSVMDLASKANLNKGQASRAAQILVDKGLISKLGNPLDGRGVTLNLTMQGKKLWQKTMRLVELRNQEIFACLSPDELSTFSQLIDRLIENNIQKHSVQKTVN